MKQVHVLDYCTGRYRIGVAENLSAARILAVKMIEELAWALYEFLLVLGKKKTSMSKIRFAEKEDFSVNIVPAKMNEVAIFGD